MSATDWNLLSSYAGILTLATASVYFGALSSLPRTRIKETSGEKTQDDDDDDEDEVNLERLTSEDAWMFPIFGSVTLFSLFLLVKYFGKEWINILMGWYFSVASLGSMWNSSVTIVRYILGEVRWKSFDRTKLSIVKGSTDIVKVTWRTPSILLMPISAIPSILFSCTIEGRRSILLANALSLSFCHSALSMLKLDSFKTGTILLSGLFIYDIWWVFGTNVMVSVATNLDVPIKLQWPKSLVFSAARGYTMLGLGDIVIPGCFVALALRYDHHHSSNDSTLSFSKPYFKAAMLAYIGGLLTTMVVMHVFNAAQPALLYLSPACIGSFVMTAFIRGELSDAWEWSDSPVSDDKINPEPQADVKEDDDDPTL